MGHDARYTPEEFHHEGSTATSCEVVCGNVRLCYTRLAVLLTLLDSRTSGIRNTLRVVGPLLHVKVPYLAVLLGPSGLGNRQSRSSH